MILFIRTQGHIDPVYFRFSPENYATFAQSWTVISLCDLFWCDLLSLPNVTGYRNCGIVWTWYKPSDLWSASPMTQWSVVCFTHDPVICGLLHPWPSDLWSASPMTQWSVVCFTHDPVICGLLHPWPSDLWSSVLPTTSNIIFNKFSLT